MQTENLAFRVQGGIALVDDEYVGRVVLSVYDGDIVANASQEVLEEAIKRGAVRIVIQAIDFTKGHATQDAAMAAMKRLASAEFRRVLAIIEAAGGRPLAVHDWGTDSVIGDA